MRYLRSDLTRQQEDAMLATLDSPIRRQPKPLGTGWTPTPAKPIYQVTVDGRTFDVVWNGAGQR